MPAVTPYRPQSRASCGTASAGAALVFATLNPGSQPAQPFVDPLVAAFDLADVVDDGVPLSGHGGEEHPHPGPDVGAVDDAAAQFGGSGDDGAVRIAQHDPCAHPDQLVDEEEPRLEHLLEHEQRALTLRRHDDGHRKS